jgi:parvulin-like peptidyl-prolyl isomerase
LGYLKRNELGEFAEKIFPLAVGRWEGPLINDGKYLFVQCTGRKDPQYRSFDESKEEIRGNLMTMKWFDARSSYLDPLKRTIKIEAYTQKLKNVSLN